MLACGTQLGQIFIADIDAEPTDDNAKIYYFKQRYYSTSIYLEKEKESPRILLPTGNYQRVTNIYIVETGMVHSTSVFDIAWFKDDN